MMLYGHVRDHMPRVLLSLPGSNGPFSVEFCLDLEWNDDTRPTEILVLEGNPLLGMLLLEGSHVHVEATDGGEVVIEPL